MIAFEFSLNGKRLGTAGVGDLGVLSGIVTWVRRAAGKQRGRKVFEEELTLEVSGLAEHAHLHWLRRELTVGDSVTVKVVAAPKVDVPSRSEPRDDEADVERGERRYFEYLKRKYGSAKPPVRRRNK